MYVNKSCGSYRLHLVHQQPATRLEALFTRIALHSARNSELHKEPPSLQQPIIAHHIGTVARDKN